MSEKYQKSVIKPNAPYLQVSNTFIDHISYLNFKIYLRTEFYDLPWIDNNLKIGWFKVPNRRRARSTLLVCIAHEYLS